MGNGTMSEDELRAFPGFMPYPARKNYRAVSTATLSDMVAVALYTDFGNMAADFERDLHQQLTYAELYRPLRVQQWRKDEQRNGGPSAAAVGFSTHGLAASWDIRNGVGGGPGSSTYDWLNAHGAEYGFYNDVNDEYWHWHHKLPYSITKPRSTSEAGTGPTTPIPEDDLPYSEAQLRQYINQEVVKVIQGSAFQEVLTAAIVASTVQEPLARQIVNQEGVKIVNGSAFKKAVGK